MPVSRPGSAAPVGERTRFQISTYTPNCKERKKEHMVRHGTRLGLDTKLLYSGVSMALATAPATALNV